MRLRFTGNQARVSCCFQLKQICHIFKSSLSVSLLVLLTARSDEGITSANFVVSPEVRNIYYEVLSCENDSKRAIIRWDLIKKCKVYISCRGSLMHVKLKKTSFSNEFEITFSQPLLYILAPSKCWRQSFIDTCSVHL